MWVERRVLEGLRNDVARLESELEAAKMRAEQIVRRANDRVLAAERRTSDLAERLVDLAKRPPVIVQPPDTAAIVKETVMGMATVLNGWRENPSSQVTQHQILSPEDQGLDDRAGVPQDLSNFVPPWEDLGPTISPTPPVANGNYTPYVPGGGSPAPNPSNGGRFE